MPLLPGAQPVYALAGPPAKVPQKGRLCVVLADSCHFLQTFLARLSNEKHVRVP